jgi:hypothetical protein
MEAVTPVQLQDVLADFIRTMPGVIGPVVNQVPIGQVAARTESTHLNKPLVENFIEILGEVYVILKEE